jgi:hypothetical protein
MRTSWSSNKAMILKQFAKQPSEILKAARRLCHQ